MTFPNSLLFSGLLPPSIIIYVRITMLINHTIPYRVSNVYIEVSLKNRVFVSFNSLQDITSFFHDFRLQLSLSHIPSIKRIERSINTDLNTHTFPVGSIHQHSLLVRVSPPKL